MPRRSRPIQILFTHPHFWPHVRRGAEREIHDLGQRLAADGHRVRLLTSTPDGVTRRRRIGDMDVRYVRVPAPTALVRRGWHHEAVFGAIAGACAAASSADLIHAWLYADAAFISRMPVAQRRRPLVLKLTGTVLSDRIAGTPVDDRLFRRAIDGATEVWCNSRFAVESMADFGVPMRVVPAGIDRRRFRPGGNRSAQPTVLCTSAPDEPRKRLIDLITAWPSVVAEVPDARLVVAGPTKDATLHDRLPPRVRQTVDFTGSLDDDALVNAYRSAWVVAAPAVYEALGLTTLESLACGTPVVGARSGATTELLETNPAGTLFTPADVASCAEALLFRLTEPPTADVEASAVARTDEYDWDHVVERITARYRALLEERT